MKKVYLAGAMEFAHDGGIGWRQEFAGWLAERLGHGVLDPTVFEHDQLSDEERNSIKGLKSQRRFDEVRRLASRIVHYDARLLLEQSDYVVCLWNEATQLGCGTAGEITLACWAGKPVHLLLDYPDERASTWMIGCTTTIHHDWDDLKRTLIQHYASTP
ncbi:hypothetical protein GC173_01195 [bacterium]|nr:hypothetical protein [bacterium]